ncbi:MAG: glycosyltransferase [Candidatus Omnitrophica bacterium]|nr:glycosyltransferase [Candidatus Omnitrophota bacterium]MDD5552967.1 glycosyltransferase [Candidatus Omnitrophota bacterium]
MDNLPFVSVIIPAYNSEKTIGQLIQSLLGQTYPKERFEIIIVDNNSRDNTYKIAGTFPVKVIQENKAQSSYAARNRGIEQACGELFAFIDADCTASGNWLEEGVRKLHAENADLVGGRVGFVFTKKRTASEMYDAITHFNMEKSVKTRQTTGSGNLFVRAPVFKKIGLFREDVRSGGDMQFTYKAVNCGYKLVYSQEALILHPARTFKELLKKSFRVGTGCVDILKARSMRSSQVMWRILKDFLPPSPLSINRSINESGTPGMKREFMKILAVAYLCKITRGAGMVKSLIGKARI